MNTVLKQKNMYDNLLVSFEHTKIHLEKQTLHLKTWDLNQVADSSNTAYSL